MDDPRGVGNDRGMRGKLLPLVLAAVLGAPLLGCTPSPERVCKRLIDLQGARFSSEQERIDGLKYCVQLKTEQKRQNPERYKCESECAIGEHDLVAASECNAKCK